MYAITGITGRVGSIVARALLQQRLPVRAVVRNPQRAAEWSALGAEVAVAALDDAPALTRAFAGTAGVFLMTPPNFDPEPGFPDSVRHAAALEAAFDAARPGKIVCLSTVGAHVRQFNLLNNAGITEDMLRHASAPVVLLRAAWFMENAQWDVAAARAGKLVNYLQPEAHCIPMISVRDIGRTAVQLLQETWVGTRVVELEAARRYSARDLAAGFAKALGAPVGLESPPRAQWEAGFRSQGMRYPQARLRMLDGFNEGWIDFEGGGAESRRGEVALDAVLQTLVDESATA